MNTEQQHEPQAEPNTESQPVSAEDRERLDEIKRLAASGELEAPAGAEEIVAALAEVVAERDEHFTRLQRTAADHQNFQRRARQNETDARDLATRSVVQAVLPVLDNFDLALGQNPDTVTVEQVLGGVRVVKDELLRVLSRFGVVVIEPVPNDVFEPGTHEAVAQIPGEGVGPGRISTCMQVGYALHDRIVRAAKVAVAPGEDVGEDADSDAAASDEG